MMDQTQWQKKIIREEYVLGAEEDVHKDQIHGIRPSKRVHNLFKQQKTVLDEDPGTRYKR